MRISKTAGVSLIIIAFLFWLLVGTGLVGVIWILIIAIPLIVIGAILLLGFQMKSEKT